MPTSSQNDNSAKTLRKGWTTGACATAACAAAWQALLGGEFPDPVQISLPKGQQPRFALLARERGDDFASATIEKDAGDDPDVTHGAWITTRVSRNAGLGVRFFAGDGVGTVTRAGLPIPPGEPAINPVPRQMMRTVIEQLAAQYDVPADADISISVRHGAALAKQTWNPRLGILGGISILGTTGIVHPFSCSAWIHSIHSGVDIARAAGTPHVAGCTGSTSESVVQQLYGLGDSELLDMGDFVGGLLKYLRQHPLPRLTLGGGFGKFCKLANGRFDLHSKRSQVDFNWLAEQVAIVGGDAALTAQCRTANTALEVLRLCEAAQCPIAEHIAQLARTAALSRLRGETAIDVLIISRDGRLLARVEDADDG